MRRPELAENAPVASILVEGSETSTRRRQVRVRIGEPELADIRVLRLLLVGHRNREKTALQSAVFGTDTGKATLPRSIVCLLGMAQKKRGLAEPEHRGAAIQRRRQRLIRVLLPGSLWNRRQRRVQDR